MTKINWKEEMSEFHASLPERLEKVALMAEISDHWTDTKRLMPAAGVADILYEALDEIQHHRRTKDQESRLDAAWRAWQSEESRDRGYDFELCRRLRAEYEALRKELTDENA